MTDALIGRLEAVEVPQDTWADVTISYIERLLDGTQRGHVRAIDAWRRALPTRPDLQPVDAQLRQLCARVHADPRKDTDALILFFAAPPPDPCGEALWVEGREALAGLWRWDAWDGTGVGPAKPHTSDWPNAVRAAKARCS